MNNEIPLEHHIVRYCSPSSLDENNFPLPSAFTLKNSHKHLSVDWLEFFKKTYKENIDSVLKALTKRLTIKENGALAILNVNKIKEEVEKQHKILLTVMQISDSYSGVYNINSSTSNMIATTLFTLVAESHLIHSIRKKIN